MRKGYVDGPGGQIHYREDGTGEPLLLLHQTASSGQQYLAAFPRLVAGGRRVIAMDTPGYGMSDLPPGEPNVDGYVEATLALLDALSIDRAAVLGHHTGATIALHLAWAHPDRVSQLMLNGTPLYTDEERPELLERLPTEAPPIKEDGSHLLAPWKRRMAFVIDSTRLEVVQRCVTETLSVRDHAWYAFKAVIPYPFDARLREIAVPTLLLTNTGDDIYHLTLRAREARPDLPYVELEGGTHDIVDEQPEAWSAAVLGFLRAS
jgi:pimeloyl-ACP methyl ester carboxylesterase